MTSQIARRALLACAAALSFGAAASLQAQDTTRTRTDSTTRRTTSDRRIPVRKESSGEVTTPRTTAAEKMRLDSIARADSLANLEKLRADSIASIEKLRQDSLAAAAKVRQDSIDAVNKAHQDSIDAVNKARQDSIARADSIAQAEQLRRQSARSGTLFHGSGFYMGVGAGTAAPLQTFHDLGYDNGFNVVVPIGWHKPGNALGVRLDLGYQEFNGKTFATVGATPTTLENADPKVYSATLGATLKFPFNAAKTSSFYLVGGGGLYVFRNYGRGSAFAGYLGNDVLDPQDDSFEKSVNKWGVNGGAGLEFAVGAASLFLESRLVNVFANRSESLIASEFVGDRANHVRWVPITLGVTFR